MSKENNKVIAPTNLKPLNQWWVVCYSSGNVAHWSISGTRKGCISAFLEGSNFKWSDAPKNGWFAIKVNIKFNVYSQPTPQ